MSIPNLREVARNSIVSLFGKNFTPSGFSRTISSQDIVDARIPTVVAGVCIQVGDDLAPLFFVSPTQVNFQIPSTTPIRDRVPVQVIRNCGDAEIRSNVEWINVRSVSPELFHFQVSGVGWSHIAAADAISGKLLGPPDLLPGLELTPAKPGGLVTVYGTGFGETAPSLASGHIAPVPAQTVAPTEVWLGDQKLTGENILYAGVTPNNPGLYQLNFRVPETANDGDISIRVQMGDRISPAASTLAIYRGGSNAARLAQLAKFTGTWLNENLIRPGVTRIQVSGIGDRISIRAWGSCSPVDCDWGENTTSIADAGDGILGFRWRFPHAEILQEIIAAPDGRIQASSRTRYTDNSGRRDTLGKEEFSRPPTLLTTPGLTAGAATRARVVLDKPAATGGRLVRFSSDSNLVHLPENVVVPAGSSTMDIEIHANMVSSPERVTVTTIIGDAKRIRPLIIGLPLKAPVQLSPPAGAVFNIYPRKTTVTWEAVAGAERYFVEVDYYYFGKWCSEDRGCRTSTGSSFSTSHTFEFVGAQPGRWRVWARDGNGADGQKSEWRRFLYTT